MRTIRLDLAFVGTRYEGWQSQRKGRTVQELFEKILGRILKEAVSVVGCSRTDSGVHARHFVAHFRTAASLSDDAIRKALNFYLPPDVVVQRARTAPASFHARFHARYKIYVYAVWNDPTRPVFEAPFVLWHPAPLDVGKMREAAKILTGRHDFSAFRDGGQEDSRNPVRSIHSLKVLGSAKRLKIRVQGDGFLRHMVRILAGTLLEVGKARLRVSDIRPILASKDRKRAGPTAKACALTLLKVQF